MLYLNDNLPEIAHAKQEHLRYVTCRISKRLWDESCADTSCLVCTKTSLLSGVKRTSAVNKLAGILKTNSVLNIVISSKPYQLIMISNFLWGELVSNFKWGLGGYEDYVKISKLRRRRTAAEDLIYLPYQMAASAFKTVFEYTTWFGGDEYDRYDAYILSANLNRNTCTYCNRIYTHTVDKKKHGKVTRPQFDHWYSKSKHPALALSFYNLIPSCSVCNSSVKGTLDFDLQTHLHPYTDCDSDDLFTYSYHYDRSTKRYHIDINSADPSNIRIQKTYDELKLREVFDTHHAELADLIKIKKAYTTKYIARLKAAFPGMSLSDKEVYRLTFGVELDEADYYKRPLSKFKKDILKKLKVIK